MDKREDTQEQQTTELLSHELMVSSMVHEVARVMHSATTLDQALDSLLLGISELTGVQAMALFLIREGQAALEAIHSHGVPARDLTDLKLTLAHDGVYGCVASHRHILVDPVSEEDPLAGLGSRSYLMLPLSARAPGPAPGERPGEDGFRIHPIGVLWLDTTPPCPPLTAQLVSYLSGLCQQAGSLLETLRVQKELALANAELKAGHARLSEAYLALSRAQTRIEEDLDRARAIQNSLLPATFPTRGLRRAASRYIPAGKVGGDYYDCFELEPGVLGMVVADVSGHGIAAALVMSMFKALLHNFATLDRSPAAALQRINRTFLGQFGGAHFVTAWYGVFEQETRRLTWSNAGHVPQYLLQYPPAPAAGAARKDTGGSPTLSRPALEELPSQGLVLGIFPDTFIKDASVDLAPEARLFLYSDGITEAHGEGGRMFGAEPLMDLALDLRDEHPAAVIDELMKVREAFLARAPVPLGGRAAEDLSDDATFVILDL
ncbi:MAG TPA: PP2C family protein-serine/threonine phosphatase [Fibrobacteria bacterium]|nr:PP2C family protein-serine/threonine phosphatase [Fibrobacteria bacterium]